MCKETHRFSKPLNVESIAYSHGLFCASHPKFVITTAVLVVVVCSLPFFVTTSGDLNSPKTWKTQWLNYRTPVTVTTESPQWIVNDATQFSARTPSWFIGLPLAVIQQVYVRLELACGEESELCRKSQYSKMRMASSHLINRMEDTIKTCQPVFHPAVLNLSHTLTRPPTPHPHPTYMGVLSPSLDSLTNKWDKSHNSTLGYHSLKELLYGGFWELEHHLSRREGMASGQDQQHVFGLTFVLQPSREGFNNLTKCLDVLRTKWPSMDQQQEIIIHHFYFEPEWRLIDFAPLIVLYSIVFLYISFSVGKIDLVKSKVGLGITASLTVVASLTMSMGICTFFGVSISLSGSEIYPYVVIIIGLENILIVVKAVISTPEELEVKYRIAVGLSKEGWAILQNLLTLLCMISLSLLVFNYTMREFCVLALVGVLCDAFLQLVFFTTVLSVDLRRLELSDLSSQPLPDSSSIPDSPGGRGSNPCPSSVVLTTSKKWRSKRVKFFYFLARVRPVSRALMIAFSVVLVAWFTNTETFHNIVADLLTTHPITSPTFLSQPGLDMPISDHSMQQDLSRELNENESLSAAPTDSSQLDDSEERLKSEPGRSSQYYFDAIIALNESDVFVNRVRSEAVTGVRGVWRNMVTTHWPRLLRYAGFDLNGRFLTLLPPISLTLHVGFPTLPTPSHPHTPTLTHFIFHMYTLRVLFLVTLVISVILYVGFLISSANHRHRQSLQRGRTKKVTGRVVCLKGHKQDIDCVCVEGDVLVSASLDGDIRVWSANPGSKRCLRTIIRSELCGEPPPNSVTTNTSNRLAADGCEDVTDSTPSATPHLTNKAKGVHSKHMSSSTTQTMRPSPLLSQAPLPSHPTHHSQIPQVSHTSYSTPNSKSLSTHSLPSLFHQPHPLPTPPQSPSSAGTFAFQAHPLPVYYAPQVSNVQSELSKSNDSSRYHSPNAVQVVTATQVKPTPQQACVAPPIPQQTLHSSSYHRYTTVHSQYSTKPAQYSASMHSQYTSPHTRYTTAPIQYATVRSQYSTSQSLYANVSNSMSTPQQLEAHSQNRTSSSGCFRPTRTHTRAMSHGQLSFHKPAATSHGRASVSHISLQVSPSEDTPTYPSYASPPSPHISSGTVMPTPRVSSGTGRPTPHMSSGTDTPTSHVSSGIVTPTPHMSSGTVRPTPHVSSGTVTPTPHMSSGTVMPTPHVSSGTVMPTPHVSSGTVTPTPHVSSGTVMPTPHVSSGTVMPTPHVSSGTVTPTPHMSSGTDTPTSHVSSGIVTPTPHMSSGTVRPTPHVSSGTVTPTPHMSSGTVMPTPHVSSGTVMPTPHMSSGTVTPTPHVSSGTVTPTPHRSSTSMEPPLSGSTRLGYGVRRHSSVSVQRAHSVGSRSDLRSSQNLSSQAVGSPSSCTSPYGPPISTLSGSYSSLHSTDSSTQCTLQHKAVVSLPHSTTAVHHRNRATPDSRTNTPTSITPPSNVHVPLCPPVISTPRLTPTDSLCPPVGTSTVNSIAAHTEPRSSASSVPPSSTHHVKPPEVTGKEQLSSSPTTLSSVSNKDPNSGPYRRGHVRNHSLGNDLPHRRSMGHARNRSVGSVAGPFLPKTLSSRQASIGNLSMASVNSFLPDSPFPALPQTPNSETGYDFAAHFNLFSQYTANMAIQYFSVPERNLVPEPSVPPVWCMEIWNRTIAVGCGNGQVEAWNADTGSLIFCLNLSPIGVATIAITSQGIFTGHMDGAINLIGHNGLIRKSVHIHSEPISVLCCHGDRVIAGSYDSIVSVYRSMDLLQVTTVHGHYGNIRDIICVDGPTCGCVSGCSKGLVLHWDVETGECIHDYGMYEGGVVKLGWNGWWTVALFTDCFRVWDCIEGTLKHTISLDGLCNNFTLMGSKYITASFESHMVIYDIDSGDKHSEQHLHSDRTITLINHILTLDEASVVCTSGKDLHIVPCQVKLKVD